MVLYQTTGSAQRRLFLYLCVTITSIHKKPAISIHHCCLKNCRLSQETLHIWNALNSVGIGFAMYSILYKLISTSYHVIIQKVIWPLGMLQIPFSCLNLKYEVYNYVNYMYCCEQSKAVMQYTHVEKTHLSIALNACDSALLFLPACLSIGNYAIACLSPPYL